MRPHLGILVATLSAISIPAAAQTTGGGAQQPPAQTQPAQTPPAESPPAQAPAQQSEQLKPAKAADVKKGAAVSDQKGGTVGKVDSVDAEGVVISTGSVRAKVPLSSFGVGEKGLVIGATKAELEAEAKKASKPK